MLSLERCREILGSDAPEDDRQLAERRDEAYRLARLLFEIFQEQGPQQASSPPQTLHARTRKGSSK